MKKDRPVAKGEPKRDLSHPVGTGVGALAGGLAGRGIADMINPAAEEDHWRDNWNTRSYIDRGFTYDQDYGPAYCYGWEAYPQYHARSWDEMEPELESGWAQARGESRLSWERAKHATRDAWHRVSDAVERAMPCDSDRDNK